MPRRTWRRSEGCEGLPLPPGYYGVDSLLMLIAFMARARLEAVESLRACAPGEWGKLLGLDRLPEVRTLREKIGLLSQGDQADKWSADRCRRWMAAAPEPAGILYIDAPVRVYYGEQTPLPRHYLARQRLGQRATVDYWVNANDGQPFFRVTQAVDPGLIKVLEGEILPRLERDIPGQPSAEALATEPLRHRLTLVFAREGYSPAWFKRLKARRVACLCYRKYPGEDGSPEEFIDGTIELRTGERVRTRLAERGTLLGGVVWVREIRKRCDTGRQVALISTDYQSSAWLLAATLFARWSPPSCGCCTRDRRLGLCRRRRSGSHGRSRHSGRGRTHKPGRRIPENAAAPVRRGAKRAPLPNRRGSARGRFPGGFAPSGRAGCRRGGGGDRGRGGIPAVGRPCPGP